MAQTGDQVGDLHSRQLATLAGLGPLGDLDLQLFALVEVFGGHAKAARGDLFDLGRRVVAIGFGVEMRGVFAALARVRLGPNAVHRHVQGLVRLRAQRAQRHARCHKPLADRGDAFHLFQWDRFAHGLDVHQVAQMDRRGRLHLGAVLLPHLERGIVAGHLQHMHAGRFPGVGLALGARLIEPADGQHVGAIPAQRMNLFGLGLDAGDANAADAAGHAGEILGTHGAAQADSLKVQTAAIGRHNADPHLGHDLQQALIDGIAIARHRLCQGPVDQAPINPVGQRILGQVGVDHCGPTANQHGKIMRVDTLRRAHVQRTKSAQALTGQVAVDGTCGQDHRHCDAVPARMLVGQHNMARAGPHGILGLSPDAFQPCV
mmetsp:Transcript_7117/g.11628  ORF Transcript_7117/g.11628 Transcript_7117/m.11628 type:complete len:375 (-) Transcript_7117:1930-3054(-)